MKRTKAKEKKKWKGEMKNKMNGSTIKGKLGEKKRLFFFKSLKRFFKYFFLNEYFFFMEKMKNFKSTIEAEIAHIEKYLIRSWHKTQNPCCALDVNTW